MNITKLLLLALQLTVVACRDYRGDEVPTIYSCLGGVGRFRFDYEPDGNPYWSPICKYPPAMSTMLLCIEELNEDTLEKTFQKFSDLCRTFGSTDVSVDELKKALENGTKNAVDESQLKPGLVRSPVFLNTTGLWEEKRELKSFFHNFTASPTFAKFIVLYWALTLVGVGFFNHLKNTKYVSLLNAKWSNKLRCFFVSPTLRRHSHPLTLFGFESLIPSTQENAILISYFFVVTLFCVMDYQTNKMPTEGKSLTLVRFVADRTGIISFGQVPLLVLFAGRNNLLLRISGIPYSGFIAFHKWISRTMGLLALIHSVLYLFYSFVFGSLLRDQRELYFVMGEVAMVACIVLIVQAVYFFRKTNYEWFLCLHIAFAVIFLAGCILHTMRIGFAEWIYASCAFWVLDRVIRVKNTKIVGAQIESMGSDYKDPTFKITFLRNNLRVYPGCFVYLQFLDWRLPFWQSHPFSIYADCENVYVYVKPKQGITNTLYRLLSSDGKIHTKLCVEGPYGDHNSLSHYDSVVLIAGGNGIPGIYYHAVDASKNLKQNITLVWTIRDIETLRWFYTEISHLEKWCSSRFQIYIYITGAVGYNSTDDSDLSTMYKTLGRFVTFCSGRPDCEKVIQNAMGESTAVASCCPPLMSDTLRGVIGNLMSTNMGRIDLFEELQVW